MEIQPKIELHQAEVDETDQSFFRLLVNNQSIRYMTVDPGIYSAEDTCLGPSLISLLPKFPPGDWNDGLVALDTKEGQGRPHFASLNQTQFPGVENTLSITGIYQLGENYKRAYMRLNVHYSMMLSSSNLLDFFGNSIH
jgi:hypothetical protein